MQVFAYVRGCVIFGLAVVLANRMPASEKNAKHFSEFVAFSVSNFPSHASTCEVGAYLCRSVSGGPFGC